MSSSSSLRLLVPSLRSVEWFVPASCRVALGRSRMRQSSEAARELRHQDPQWQTVKPHLPDPATATADQLEMVGDVLRARRFPEDALDYYGYALRTRRRRGAADEQDRRDRSWSCDNTAAARAYFQRAVQAEEEECDGVEQPGRGGVYGGRFATAISDYKRAIKLDKKSAIYHSNLATAYFEEKNYKDARGGVQDCAAARSGCRSSSMGSAG